MDSDFRRTIDSNPYFCLVQLLLKGASERGAKRIRVHALTDGRDVLDGTSVGFMETLENDLAKLREKGIDAQIASGGGRMYVTMDRYEVNPYASTFLPVCSILFLGVFLVGVGGRACVVITVTSIVECIR